jgi:ATP-dependent Clp protease protease subunit
MFTDLLNAAKKTPAKKPAAKKTPAKKPVTPKAVRKEPVAAPAVCKACNPPEPVPDMKAPGSYLRENGIMMLVDKFDQEKIMPLVAQIYEYNLMPDELQPSQLTLIINSPGGSVHSAFHLIDAMMMSEIPIVTIGKGLVASCGVLTIMAGDRRLVTHNTSVMSHQYSWGSRGKEHELQGIVKEFDMASSRMIEHYKKCTKKSEKYIRKHLLHPTDEWLTPAECVKHGIVDEVVQTY